MNVRGLWDGNKGGNFCVGFNTFIAKILERVPVILGRQFAQNMLQEIDKLLNYVDTYQAPSPEKNLVIGEAQKVLADATEKIAALDKNKVKSGGLLSKFKTA